MGLLRELFDDVTLAYQEKIREALRCNNPQLATDLDMHMQQYVALTKGSVGWNGTSRNMLSPVA